jgi:hypothetical protein
MRRTIAMAAGCCCAGFLLWLAFQLAEPLGLWDSRRGSGILGMLWASPIATVSLLAVARAIGGAPLGKRLTILVLALGTLGIWLASGAPESKFLVYPLIETRFAQGFDLHRFRDLRPGMSPEEVLKLAGPPLFKREGWWGYQLEGSPSTIWSYSGEGQGRGPTIWVGFGDYAWQAFEVGFRDGRVVAVSRKWRYD